jgi:hypothetical protein
MEERLGYLRPVMQCDVNAEHLDHAGTVFQAMLTADGFTLLVEQEFARGATIKASRLLAWALHSVV